MSEKQCENPCLFRYTWPDKDESYICLKHAQKLLSVANAIGLHLQLIQFAPAYPYTDWPNCKQIVNDKEP